LKAKEDAKAEKEAAKLKAKEDAKAKKEAAKLKAKEDAKAEKEAAKLKAKEDAKAEKEAAKLKAKEDAKAEKNAANEEKNAENDAENSLLDFISQFKNKFHNNCKLDLDSLDHDIKKFVYFYLFTHLIFNNSTSIESFMDFDWLLIYQSFNKHFSTFNNILNNYFKPIDNDIVSDLIYHANLNNNDIDIDVKLHVINGQKVLIDSQNVCYHFNHHKPIGKLINNNIVEF
jgi:flagellar biosynthesis GTPase FlhF